MTHANLTEILHGSIPLQEPRTTEDIQYANAAATMDLVAAVLSTALDILEDCDDDF